MQLELKNIIDLIAIIILTFVIPLIFTIIGIAKKKELSEAIINSIKIAKNCSITTSIIAICITIISAIMIIVGECPAIIKWIAMTTFELSIISYTIFLILPCIIKNKKGGIVLPISVIIIMLLILLM